MKKIYQSIEMKIVTLEALDVITASNVLEDDNVGFTPNGKWVELWD